MLPGWGDWERCNWNETVRQWISSAGSYSALIYILSNAFEAQTMCWPLEMNTSSSPSPPPKADISYLTQILIYATGQGFCLMPPSLPEWGAWNKTKCLEKCSLPPCSPGVLGAAGWQEQLSVLTAINSTSETRARSWLWNLFRFCSNSAHHQGLEVIAVCRVLDGQWEKCWRALSFPSKHCPQELALIGHPCWWFQQWNQRFWAALSVCP